MWNYLHTNDYALLRILYGVTRNCYVHGEQAYSILGFALRRRHAQAQAEQKHARIAAGLLVIIILIIITYNYYHYDHAFVYRLRLSRHVRVFT